VSRKIIRSTTSTATKSSLSNHCVRDYILRVLQFFFFRIIFSRGACRLITVSKFPTEAISSNSSNQLPKQFTFALNNNQLIQDMNTYLQTFPISSEENDLLQAKIQKTPASLNGYFKKKRSLTYSSFSTCFHLDWFYCALFRSGNPLCQSSDSKARIPDETFLSHEYFLPIDQTSTRENLIHLIDTNKILFVNGPPAIGKSLRVDNHFCFQKIHSSLFN